MKSLIAAVIFGLVFVSLFAWADNARPAVLAISLPATVDKNSGILHGYVTLSSPASVKVKVTLTSSNSAQLTVPVSVTVRAGQSSVAFSTKVINNTLLTGTQVVTVAATDEVGDSSGLATVSILDDQTTTLSVTLPASATEGVGVLANAGTVSIPKAAGADVTVQLTSDNPLKIMVPATVVIPSGETSITFDVTVVDDGLLDGTQSASVIASVTNWTPGSATMTVSNNLASQLSLSVPATVTKNDGVDYATVRTSGVVVTPLTVTLSSSRTGNITVPATVTIPAGSSSASVPLTILNNGLKQGEVPVILSATAPGFTSADATTQEIDNVVDHYGLVLAPGTLTTGLPFTVTITAYAVDNTIAAYQGTAALTVTKGTVSPASTGSFVNGVWTGSVTVTGNNTQVQLVAGSKNATGDSPDFNVGLPALLSVTPSTISGSFYQGHYLNTDLVIKNAGGLPLTWSLAFGPPGTTTTTGGSGGGGGGVIITTGGDGGSGGVTLGTIVTSGGTGALTLNGANSYIGSTTMSSGTLPLNGIGTLNPATTTSVRTPTLTLSEKDSTVNPLVPSAYPTSGTLAPGASRTVKLVLYAPASSPAGGYPEVVALASNDPSTPQLQVPVTATVLREVPLTLTLPASTTGGAGVLAGAGTVAIPAAVTFDTVVTLASLDSAKIEVPTTVTIPAGETSAKFDVTVLNTNVLDGALKVVVVGASESTSRGRAAILVADGVSATLGVQLPATLDEADANGLGTLTLSAPPTTDVTVHLSSSAASDLAVPATAVIPAGKTSVTFPYTIGSSLAANASRVTTITASEPGWVSGMATVLVTNKVSTDVWTQFGNNPAHTGVYAGALTGGTFKAGWTKTINTSAQVYPVAVVNDSVFATDDASNLTALKASDGKQLWQDNFGYGDGINPPTYYGGKVYVQEIDANENGTLHSFDGTTGQATWTSPFSTQWANMYAPTVSKLGVFADGGDGGLYGFNFDGSQRFLNENVGGYDEWTPTLDNGILYVWTGNYGDGPGTFNAIDLTGTLLWSVAMPYDWEGWSMNCAAPILGNFAFVNGGTKLGAVDLTKHAAAWKINGNFTGTPAVGNGRVYVITGSEVLILNAATGAKLGTYSTRDTYGLTGQPVLASDSLVVSSNTATYLFSLKTGALLQTIPVGGSVTVASGSLFIATNNSYIDPSPTASLCVYRPTPILTPESAMTAGTSNTVSWAACPDATGYVAQAATTPKFTNPLSSGWITGTSYTFTGLTAGTKYYFRAQAERVVHNMRLWTGPWSDVMTSTQTTSVTP